MTRYFFDAHALIRVFGGHPSYERFSGSEIVTDQGHLYEFARHFLKVVPAREVLTALRSLDAERSVPNDEDLVAAAKLMRQHRRMSAQDALGYVLARRDGLKFLTGDAAFRRLPGVEYVRPDFE